MEKIQKNKAINKLPAWSPNSIDSLGSCMDIVENTNCDDEFNNLDNTQIDTPPSRNNMIIDKILSPSNQSVKRKLDFKDRSLSPELIPAVEVLNAVNTIEEVIYTSSLPFKVSMTNATTTDNSALDILNKINRTILNTWYEIKTMTERIENIEKCMTNKTNIFEIHETTLQGIDHVLQHILCNLPLKTEEDLTIFEEKLLDMQLKKKMNLVTKGKKRKRCSQSWPLVP
ncbi:uncharacterized protein LOC132937432 [Metopolophium dirhodum]|uniref:uncharacterized protein LOC132937432 n=1 Tax=Metopolophium dirhodum TaxID=44670 RepID=UPI00298FAC5E|nr:uncharacterized protein LOC132937432 [Metopolophium dirhodum]